MSGTIAKTDRPTFGPSRAARELGLKRGELDLAVNLGLVRTVPDEGGGGLRVTRTELDRLRAADRFPDGLRERVRTTGTDESAALMEIAPTRFTSLARFGLLVPVRFYLNRYRTIVWLYLAEELRQFAAEPSNAGLLSGRLPAEIRDGLKGGLDRRPRNWRGRHSGFLLRQAGDDPWAHAAAVASLLDPADVAAVVEDSYERAHLDRLRPSLPAHGAPGSPAAELAQRLMTASEPDEVAWFRADLAHTMETARAERPAPRPGAPWEQAPTATDPTPPTATPTMASTPPTAAPTTDPTPPTEPTGPAEPTGPTEPTFPAVPQPPTGLLGLLRRRSRRSARSASLPAARPRGHARIGPPKDQRDVVKRCPPIRHRGTPKDDHT
ncbi:DUF6397 family protein [Streptomyces sp. XY006]|uniref:DUF6397 family protein n=1 Tax=Streptomyces sp. XY006 TaxID=2021410 RepID=UPI0026D61BD2